MSAGRSKHAESACMRRTVLLCSDSFLSASVPRTTTVLSVLENFHSKSVAASLRQRSAASTLSLPNGALPDCQSAALAWYVKSFSRSTNSR